MAHPKHPRSAAQKAADKRNGERLREYNQGGGSPGPSRAKDPTGDGNPLSRSGGTGLSIKIPTHVDRELDKDRLGAIWAGFWMEANKDTKLDASEYYPPAAEPKDLTVWNRFADERELGRELFRCLWVCYMYNVPSGGSTAWGRALLRAQSLQRATGGAIMAGGPANGWQRPFDEATVITSGFGVARGSEIHKGVDVRAAVGTPVHAPDDARVDAVGVIDPDGSGGLVVRLAMKRPDGGYANDTTTGDDSGLLWSVAHLQSANVKVGDLVTRGDVVALSGNSGKTDGPHAHFITEYFNDAPLWSTDSNTRVFVDPTALYGGIPAITGTGEPQAFKPGDTMAAVVVRPGMSSPFDALQSIAPGLLPQGAGGGGVSAGTVTINNSGALTLNGGNAVSTPIKAVVDMGLIGGSSGDGGYGQPAVPDALRGIVQQPAMQAVLGNGGDIVRGIGSLAGEFFMRTFSPEGIASVARLGLTLTSATGALVGIAGPVLTFVGPWLAGIPYVGPYLTAAAEVLGPIFAGVGPVIAGAAGAGGGVLGAVGGAQGQGGGIPPPPDFDALNRMFGGVSQNFMGPPRRV